MEINQIKKEVETYLAYLEQEERSPATRAQYRRDICLFVEWLENVGTLDKETVIRYKEKLKSVYQASSVNVKLAAVNGFLEYAGYGMCRVKQLKIQHQAYCSREKELTKSEYLRLVSAAQTQKNEKLALILQTICGTGIRVSELQFITVEAVEKGEAAVGLKGKNRIILIPGKLRKRLKIYIKKKQLAAGPVFVTRSGKPLDRSNIWRQMKKLCEEAHVEAGKVFPHNLRHLFARCFYSVEKDLAKLADILGHSSINTTRIYIISTGREHLRKMDALGLVV